MGRPRQKNNPSTDKDVQALSDQTRQTILRLRKQKKLNALDVATRMGISRPFYTQLELGTRRMNLQHLFAIAKALEVKPEVLVK